MIAPFWKRLITREITIMCLDYPAIPTCLDKALATEAKWRIHASRNWNIMVLWFR